VTSSLKMICRAWSIPIGYQAMVKAQHTKPVHNTLAKELTPDLAHDRQLLFSQKYVTVIHAT